MLGAGGVWGEAASGLDGSPTQAIGQAAEPSLPGKEFARVPRGAVSWTHCQALLSACLCPREECSESPILKNSAMYLVRFL